MTYKGKTEIDWADVEEILVANGYTDERIVLASQALDTIGYMPDGLNADQIAEVMDQAFGSSDSHKSFWQLTLSPDQDFTGFEIVEETEEEAEETEEVETAEEAVEGGGQSSEVTCSKCGKPLSDPESVAAGMGPVCREHGDGGLAGWSAPEVRERYNEAFSTAKYVPFPVAIKALEEKFINANRLVTATGGDGGKHNPICSLFEIRYGERDKMKMRFVHQNVLKPFGIWVLENLVDLRKGIKAGHITPEELASRLDKHANRPNNTPSRWPIDVPKEAE